MDEKRMPLAVARAVAEELVLLLAPYCTRISIAGSIRREKPTCKDIELVLIPKEPDPEQVIARVAGLGAELFGPPSAQAEQFARSADELGQFLLSDPRFQKRRNKLGRTMFGTKNKLMLYKGIPLDIFVADESNWPMVLFIRTGGAENNQRVATVALRKGFELKQYEGGFRDKRTGTLHPMKSDEQIYAFLGLPYLAPNERT